MQFIGKRDLRLCNGCSIWQPLKNFTGGQYKCRPCRNAYQRGHYKIHKEKIKEYIVRWRHKTPENMEKWKAAYQKTNLKNKQLRAEEKKIRMENQEHTKRINLKLQDDLHRRLKVFCSETSTSMQEALVALIKELLDSKTR